MKLLKSWDLKQHVHLKENESWFLVQLMQLYVFCWGKFTATLLLSRRVVSHKDFQMPCVKFLISPTILKYIITQTQTSFKKCLSLKHVWPPFLDFRDLGFFLLLSFLFKPDGRGQCRSSRGPILITLMLCHGLTPKNSLPFQTRTCWQQHLGLHPEWEALCQRETCLCQTATFHLLKVRQRSGRNAATTLLRAATNMQTFRRNTEVHWAGLARL